MRLFLIKNVSRDPQFAGKRRANPLYVTKRPLICGNKLFPRVVMKIKEEDISDSEKPSINNLISAGIITVDVVGGPKNIQSILLEDPEENIKEEEISIPEEPSVEEDPAPPEVEEIPEEPSEEIIEDPEPSPVEIAEIVEEDEEDSSNYTESDLIKMKNSELRELLSIIDPDFSSAGIKKSILVDRILEKQND